MHHKFERKNKLKNPNLKLQSYRYYAMEKTDSKIEIENSKSIMVACKK